MGNGVAVRKAGEQLVRLVRERLGGRRPLAVPPGGFRRIAVLRLSSLGDVIQTLPVLHDLRQHCPGVAIDWVVEEAFASGIEHVVLIQGRGKGAIEDHFDRAWELEASLEAAREILGDSVPWWLAGVSLVATTFSGSGTPER